MGRARRYPRYPGRTSAAVGWPHAPQRPGLHPYNTRRRVLPGNLCCADERRAARSSGLASPGGVDPVEDGILATVVAVCDRWMIPAAFEGETLHSTRCGQMLAQDWFRRWRSPGLSGEAAAGSPGAPQPGVSAPGTIRRGRYPGRLGRWPWPLAQLPLLERRIALHTANEALQSHIRHLEAGLG